MPVTPGYVLTASQCPALVAAAGIHDPLVDAPLLNPAIAAGPSAALITFGQKTGVALEDAFRHGGGAYAIAAGAGNGLSLTDAGGLVVNVGTGIGLLDWPVVRTAVYPLTLANGVRNFVWLPSSGIPVAVSTVLTPPTAACICLGAVDTAAGVQTAIDYGPRFELRNGTLWRRTGDVGLPNDTPGSGLAFLTRTAGGLYLWDGTAYQVVGAANVANAQVTPGQVILYRIDVADGATGNVDVVLTYKSRVINAWVVKTVGAGGASDTITVNNGATAITDAMSINVADKTLVRAGAIDDASHEISSGGTLRIVRTKVSAANVACTVYVEAIRVV